MISSTDFGIGFLVCLLFVFTVLHLISYAEERRNAIKMNQVFNRLAQSTKELDDLVKQTTKD